MLKASTAVAVFALQLPLTSGAQVHPDLSGTWTLTTQSCQPAKPHRPAGSYRMVVQHTDPVLHIAISSAMKGKTHELSLSYKTNGEELHYTGLDGDDFHSAPHWEGNRLVFKITELEDGKQIHSDEIWQLRNNGAELLRTKLQGGEDKQSTCTALFTRAHEP